MRVLLTNDDGIGAQGLQALRRALLEIDGIELQVIAPDSNRSAMARSITTRRPLWIEEVDFDDGTVGYATDGTPVDCVRFAHLGLGGGSPEMIVSGINHGVNLGDDVTYSGTVAAALEGILLGIPAIAVSQQSVEREMGFVPGPRFDFSVSAPLAAALTAIIGEDGLPDGTLLNVNCPGCPPEGIEVARLGKRIYDDELEELEAVEEDPDGRKRYRIYGHFPRHTEEEGTDLAAVAEGKVAITPVHFDLTDHGGFDGVREMEIETALERVLEQVEA